MLEVWVGEMWGGGCKCGCVEHTGRMDGGCMG